LDALVIVVVIVASEEKMRRREEEEEEKKNATRLGRLGLLLRNNTNTFYNSNYSSSI